MMREISPIIASSFNVGTIVSKNGEVEEREKGEGKEYKRSRIRGA